MTVDEWLQHAATDAARRGLDGIRTVLEALARATRDLRDADFGDQPPDGSGDDV
jgi:hypothetical protein